jgi:hypothetical protein
MNKLLTEKQIINNPELYFKWMCYNLLITIDNQVFNLSFRKMKEQLIGGSYCFYCNGKYRTKKWIRHNCIEVLGKITN